jgi:hypothetical protein
MAVDKEGRTIPMRTTVGVDQRVARRAEDLGPEAQPPHLVSHPLGGLEHVCGVGGRGADAGYPEPLKKLLHKGLLSGMDMLEDGLGNHATLLGCRTRRLTCRSIQEP